MLGEARFRALALVVCVLLTRPILFTCGGVLQHDKIGDVPLHGVVYLIADDGDDDDDAIEEVFAGDPLFITAVAFLPPLQSSDEVVPPIDESVSPDRPDPADHPPRTA